MKYNDNGTYKDIYVKSFDTLPVGTEVDYDGNTVPTGWTEVPNHADYQIQKVYDQDLTFSNFVRFARINSSIFLTNMAPIRRTDFSIVFAIS